MIRLEECSASAVYVVCERMGVWVRPINLNLPAPGDWVRRRFSWPIDDYAAYDLAQEALRVHGHVPAGIVAGSCERGLLVLWHR